MNRKKISFKAFLVTIPFLFFIFLELFLRLFGLFNPESLFEKKNNNLIQVNSNIGKKYFDNKKVPVPNMYPQKFSAKKSKNTFRVLCLGGSTTAGFPYEMNVPFPQQLKFMLEDNFPEKKIESINLGLSAINSFTILDWIPQIINQNPDLIIIYMGHNEFYGAYGASSKISFTNNGSLVRLGLKMKNFNSFLMLEKIITFFTSKTFNNSQATLMEKISNKGVIPISSNLREKVYKNYEKNLEIILKSLTDKDIPIIISNLTSNLLNQAPFGKNGIGKNSSMTSLEFYKKGIKYMSKEAYDSSIVYLKKSLDLDEIPFRANRHINDIIHRKSKDFKVNFINMEKIFEDNSKNGIPGDTLFSDHLHPNPKGYYLMAKTFFDKILDIGFMDDVNISEIKQTPTLFTSLDWEIGQQRLFKLKRRWPFNHQKINYSDYMPYDNDITAIISNDFVFKHHIWGKAHEDLAKHYENKMEFFKASKEYEVITRMFPDKKKYFYKLIENGKKSSRWNVVEKTCITLLKSKTESSPIIKYDLALSQRSLGDLKKSFKNVNESIESQGLNDNQLAYALFLKALILIDIKEYDDSKKILNRINVDYPGLIKIDDILKKLE
mgnify:CR=1 FL=1